MDTASSPIIRDPYQTEASPDRLAAEEALLRRFVTDHRWERMTTVLAARTRYLSVAVEDIFQPHNASAVLRSCDAFGVQDVHIIENRNHFHVNPGVELGTAQWLSLFRYRHAPRATEEAFDALRQRGYRVVATTPHTNDVTLPDFDLARGPAVLVFGTEKEGLSDAALAAADEFVRIPMHGFVESLNISVSAAICLQQLTGALRDTSIAWRLQQHERAVILNRWLRRSVRQAEQIVLRELGPR